MPEGRAQSQGRKVSPRVSPARVFAAGLALATAGADPGWAASLETIPMVISSSSVRFDGDGSGSQFAPIPVTLPYSTSINAAPGQAGCVAASYNYSIAQVAGGLEVHIDGAAFSTPSGFCSFSPKVTFDLSLAVPDYGSSLQPFMLEMEVVQSSFATTPYRAAGQLAPTQLARSTLLGREYFFGDSQNGLTVSPFAPSGDPGRPSIHSALPGDSIRMPMETYFEFVSNGSVTSGSMTLRFTYKTLRPTPVPSPGAAIQIPTGILALAMLARAR